MYVAVAIRWERAPHTRNFRTLIVAVGFAGEMALDSATRAAVKKATVVKKPNTFWTRISEEYIFWRGFWLLRISPVVSVRIQPPVEDRCRALTLQQVPISDPSYAHAIFNQIMAFLYPSQYSFGRDNVS